jgi:UDP-glucose 4-epimerase
MAVLVTGGAGYIGSQMVRRLRDARRDVIVVDDLSSGQPTAVPLDVPLVVANVGDEAAMARVLSDHEIEAVIHFAARTRVGESVVHPRLYWKGNVVATQALLDRVIDAGVRLFIFSSTAAVYGTPARVPITEDERLAPINPYGETKLAIERMLESYSRAYDFRYAALRYFNAAGADPESGLGESHDPETHLVPLVLDAALGRVPHVTIFGRDYPTRDGTCVRDYVHVRDLAEAHLAALSYLEHGGASGAFNLGTGHGHTVQEVVETCAAVSGRAIPVVVGPRRAGDPPALVASPRLAAERLAWRATRSSLEEIVRDAWAWHVHRYGGQALESPRERTSEELVNGR